VNVLEGHVVDELGIDDGADVRKVGTKVLQGVSGRAHCDCCLDLAEVLLGFAEKFFGFTVLGGRLTFLGEWLGVQDKVEVAEVLLALQ
jgi:hypothetical protein